MRHVISVALAAAVAGCTYAPPQPALVDPMGQERLSQLLAGKAAGPPQRCIPRYQAENLQAVDARTLAFRDGSRVYLNRVEGACSGLGVGYTLVMKPFGFGGPCRGDVAHVVEPSSGMIAGSCILGDFIPYTPIRR